MNKPNQDHNGTSTGLAIMVLFSLKERRVI